ncbi:MAG: type II secretion system protein [Phycisphaeraceae bacterium]|nr:type II secretion system protein [Phycisphaeraceae bacterium]
MKRRAFTLVEVLVCVVIIVTIAALTVPFFGRTQADRAMATAGLLRADLRYAQMASMADTQDPVIVRFRSDGTGYWLARLTSPNTAIARPDTGGTWDVVFGSGRAAASDHVQMAIASIPSATLRFTPLGSVHAATGTPTMTITAGGPGGPPRTCVVSVDPITGATTVTGP